MKRSGAGCGTGWTLVLLACAGACGGGGGEKAPTFMPVAATTDGDLYTLTLGDLKMVIDGAKGARITEFSLRGTNVLVTRDQNHDNFGSTYWPSPQSSWCTAGGGCWPPPAAIDGGPYTGSVDDANTIQLASAEQAIGGVAGSAVTVTKQFSPVPESGAVDVTYTLTNMSPTDSISLAPWQVSRVATGGLTFFGQGSGPVTYAPNTSSNFTVDGMAGALWYLSQPVTHDSKAFADGTGWIAQVTPDRLLYLVSYPDFEPADGAPGEAEIELYTNSSDVYVEFEQQGALAAIAPGASLTWVVRWKLRPLPGGTTVAPGNADLASFAAAALAE
jgi:hypothetical protein